MKINSQQRAYWFQFGDNMCKIRNFRGVSREKMAEDLDICLKTLQKYETGQSQMPMSKMLLAAEKLKMEVGWFFHLHKVDVFKQPVPAGL